MRLTQSRKRTNNSNERDIVYWRSTIRKVVAGLVSTVAIAGLAIVPAGAATPANTSPAPPPVKSAPTPAPPVKAVAPGRGPRVTPLALQGNSGLSSNQLEENGTCDGEEFCMTYFSNGDGSAYDTAHNDPNLSDNHFISPGPGQGAVVGANSEFYSNHSAETVVVCTGVNYTGQCLTIVPGGQNNFPATFFNKIESIYWGDTIN